MSGDKGPQEIIKGFIDASLDFGIEVLFVGDENMIKEEVSKYTYQKDKIEIMHTSEVIENSDDPVASVRHKKDSSICQGLNALNKSGGDVFLSAGNTGALIAASTIIIKRLKGVRRIAIAPLIPCQDGCFMLIDVGANSECTPAFLLQFGYMGHIYMKNVMNIQNPRIGLLNIGKEDGKGTSLTVKTNKILKNTNLNYVGNIEAREIPFGAAEVVICDGFTGNVVLKLLEGTGRFMSNALNKIFVKNFFSMIAAFLLKKSFLEFKREIDYKEYGGSPILGLKKHVMKAHGNSDSKSFYNAAKQAINYFQSNAIEEIKNNILQFGVVEDETESL
jgi:glycerol-3-phosphate acyltransferase PlsX